MANSNLETKGFILSHASRQSIPEGGQQELRAETWRQELKQVVEDWLVPHDLLSLLSYTTLDSGEWLSSTRHGLHPPPT